MNGEAKDEEFDDELDADGEDVEDDADAAAFPACPHCGDAEGACAHVFAVIHEGDELLTLVPEWNEVDDLVTDLRLLTPDGDVLLDAMSRRPEAWWLRARGEGFGQSARLAGADAVAKRFHLAALPISDGGSVLFAEDTAAVRERLTTVLRRVKQDLIRLARRFDIDVDEK